MPYCLNFYCYLNVFLSLQRYIFFFIFPQKTEKIFSSTFFFLRYGVDTKGLEQFRVLRFLNAFVPTFAAHGYVFVVAAYQHLLAGGYHVAVGVDAGVDGGLAAARAAGFHLLDVVGKLEKTSRAGEEVRLEVGAQAVAHYIYVEDVHRLGKLVDLLFGEKLSLVNQHPLYLHELVLEKGVVFVADKLENVGVGFHHLALTLDAHARLDDVGAVAVVHRRFQADEIDVAFLEIVGRGQQVQRFGRTHGAVSEI